jgi:hypothetical protein
MSENPPGRRLLLLPPALAAELRESTRCAAQPEAEAALARIAALVGSGATVVALVAPPGSDPKPLLHDLADRLAPGVTSLFLPHPGLAPDEVRAWLASCDEASPPEVGPSLEDLARARARGRPGLVLLIDGAGDMPRAVAAAFRDTLARSEGRLGLVLAGADAVRLDAVLALLGGAAARVVVGAPAEAPARPEPVALLPACVAPATAPAASGPASVPRATPQESCPAPATTRPRAAPSAPRPPPRRRSEPRRVATAAAVLLSVAAVLSLARLAALEGEQPSAEQVDVAAAPLPVSQPPVPVSVSARPWARVAVDGRELGVTPLGNVPLAPGLHRFRAELADGRVIEREVRIDGHNRRVTFP